MERASKPWEEMLACSTSLNEEEEERERERERESALKKKEPAAINHLRLKSEPALGLSP